jgi:hypothetical protein
VSRTDGGVEQSTLVNMPLRNLDGPEFTGDTLAGAFLRLLDPFVSPTRRNSSVTDYWPRARPFTHAEGTLVTCLQEQISAYSAVSVRISVHFPYQPERRSVRYYLHLPVSVKLANKEMYARSENISLSGILLSSSFRIPEGSTVELAVGAGPRPDPGVRLTARGKVLRVQPTASGDFAIAIECDRAFEPTGGVRR